MTGFKRALKDWRLWLPCLLLALVMASLDGFYGWKLLLAWVVYTLIAGVVMAFAFRKEYEP